MSLGGSRWWHKCLGSCHLHGRSGWNSWLLASVWPSPGCCGEETNRGKALSPCLHFSTLALTPFLSPSFSPSFSLFLSVTLLFQLNKLIFKNYNFQRRITYRFYDLCLTEAPWSLPQLILKQPNEAGKTGICLTSVRFKKNKKQNRISGTGVAPHEPGKFPLLTLGLAVCFYTVLLYL